MAVIFRCVCRLRNTSIRSSHIFHFFFDEALATETLLLHTSPGGHFCVKRPHMFALSSYIYILIQLLELAISVKRPSTHPTPPSDKNKNKNNQTLIPRVATQIEVPLHYNRRFPSCISSVSKRVETEAKGNSEIAYLLFTR